MKINCNNEGMTINYEHRVEAVSPNMRVGELVRMWLRRRGLQQEELAPILEITASTLSRRIAGITGWSITDLVKTAAFLDVEIRDLLPDDTVEQEKVRM